MKKSEYKRELKILIENAILNSPHDLTHEVGDQITQNTNIIYPDLEESPSNWTFSHKHILAIKAMFEQSSKEGRKEILKEILTSIHQNHT